MLGVTPQPQASRAQPCIGLQYRRLLVSPVHPHVFLFMYVFRLLDKTSLLYSRREYGVAASYGKINSH